MNHVRRLPHRIAQCRLQVDEIGADLTLIDDRLLVAKQVLDRILEGEDVTCQQFVAVVEHRGDGRALATACTTHQQDEAAPLHDQALQRVGQQQTLQPRHLVRDEANHR